MGSLIAHGSQVINYIWIKNDGISQETLNNCTISNNKPSWDSTTTFLSTFNNNIHGSNFTSNNSDIIGYSIYRKDKNDNLSFVAKVDYWIKSINDFLARNNETYVYYVFPIINSNGTNVNSAPILTGQITPQWDNWSIIGIKKIDGYKNAYLAGSQQYDIWNLGINIEHDEFVQNISRTVHNTNFKFPKVVSSNQNYLSGSFSALIGNISCNGSYNDSIDLVEKWESFVCNGDIKLLKDVKGRVFPIEIISSSTSYDSNLIGQPVTVSFSYVQIMDANDISVYGV